MLFRSGDKLVLINKSVTPYDEEADLRIEGSIGEVFRQIQIKMEG